MTEAGGMPAVQRLFFAVWPDDTTATALRTAQQELCWSGGRLLHPDDLHLTLVFLGDVATERLPCIREAAEQVRVAPFDLTLTQHGYWRGPRVSWLAPDRTPQPLMDLVDQLWSGLSPCGFTREARPFSAHLTLARKAKPCATSALASPIPWRVRDFVLVTSLSVPEPPRYKVLQRWPLAEAPATDAHSGLENQ